MKTRILTVMCVASMLVGCNTVIIPDGGGDESPNNTITGNHLVTTEWLKDNLGDSKLVVIDARATADYVEEHIPGAVSASFTEAEATSYGYNVSYGGGIDFFLDRDDPMALFQDGTPEQIQEAVQDFGIDQDETVVVYDDGAHFHAARFFWTLTQHGFGNIYILDGGLHKWTEGGFDTTQEIPEVTKGDFVATAPDDTQVAVTDDVFASLSDPDQVIVSALQAEWYYGTYNAYSEPGHIPGAKMIPLGYFFNSDRTWKSAEEIQALLNVLDITPDKKVITYCGGGPLSACVHYTFKYVLGYADVQNYATSYLDWMEDPRDLPLDFYADESLLRDTDWVHWWAGQRIQTLTPVAPALVVDTRTEIDYDAGHIPWSVNIPMGDSVAIAAKSLQEWVDTLGGLGVSRDIEIVAVDERVTPQTTFLFWLLEYLGQEDVSIATDGLTGWADAGYDITTDGTIIADATNPIDTAIQPTTFTADVQSDLRLEHSEESSDHPFGRVWVVASEEVPEDLPFDYYYHVPWTQNITEAGQFDSAGALWTLYDEAGVSFFSEIVCYSDDPAEASVTYFTLRLLGFPKVSVYMP